MKSGKLTFEQVQDVRNTLILRLSAQLTLIFYGFFWVLDWFIVPEYVYVTLAMRVQVLLYAGFLLWAYKKKKKWVHRNYWPLVLVLAYSMVWGIAIMSWLDNGMESPYYAGMNMVILVMAMMHSWNLRRILIFNSSCYVFYSAPLFLGLFPIHDFATALSNQLFFASLMILPAISQYVRTGMERRDFKQRHALKQYLAQVRILATKDSLTGLNNRRHLLTLGEREIKRCERNRKPLSVIIVDIDFFKKINDTYSHGVGDEVIQSVASVLTKSVREIDVVGRYGGEEFLLVLPEADAGQALSVVARRIQQGLKEPIPTSAGPLQVTLSLGVCGKADGGPLKLKTLIDRADVALYQAKETGRNKSVEWSPAIDSREEAA